MGQLLPEKGLHVLLDAIGLLSTKGWDVKLDVIGDLERWEEPSFARLSSAKTDTSRSI